MCKQRPPSLQPPQAGTLLCAPGACARLDCTAQEGTPGACCPQSQAPVTEPPNSGCQDGATWREHTEEWAPLADPCQICRCTEGRVLCVQRQCARLCPHPASPRPGTCCPVCDGCSFEGRDYASGEPVPSAEPCTQCVCTAGEVSCQRLEPSCPPAPCSHPAHTPAQCCPTCHGCEFEGSVYQDGERFIAQGAGRCLHCTCSAGSVQCLPSLCPPAPCPHPQTLPGHCCATCPGCSYHGVTATHGQSFADPEDAQCSQCTCQAGSVQCQRGPCPPASCPHPAPGACNCPLCQGCHFQGQDLADGETFAAPQDPCEQCQCQEGAVLCAWVSCPPLTCTHPVTEPGVCCPRCQASPLCPPPVAGGVLEADGRRVPDGETWTDDADACVTCTCSLGHVQCHVEECTDLACPDGLERVQVPGTCCGQCQVPGSTCSYQGRRFESRERWQVDACTACSCVAGEVHCRSQRCPPPACGPDEAPALTPGRCCPHCHPRPATCQAFGDPHYRTFDGRLLHFQGACTYVLARDCHAEDFSVHVSNDARGHTGVSWTQEVVVQVGGTWVQLLQGGEVMVDGEAVTLPFLKEPAVYVERRSGTVLLNTHVGLQVQWDGRSHVELSVPGTYRGRTCGLCGNFNSFAQDDLRGPGGDLLPSHAALGNSWQVAAPGQDGGCGPARDVEPCQEAGYRARREANTRCGALKAPPFTRCHGLVPPEGFFAACVYDACACRADAGACLCDALEAYAAACRRAGLVLHWRSPTLCAVGCPRDRGYVFTECGPPGVLDWSISPFCPPPPPHLFWDFQLLDMDRDGRVSPWDAGLLLQGVRGARAVGTAWHHYLGQHRHGLAWADIQAWLSGDPQPPPAPWTGCRAEPDTDCSMERGASPRQSSSLPRGGAKLQLQQLLDWSWDPKLKPIPVASGRAQPAVGQQTELSWRPAQVGAGKQGGSWLGPLDPGPPQPLCPQLERDRAWQSRLLPPGDPEPAGAWGQLRAALWEACARRLVQGSEEAVCMDRAIAMHQDAWHMQESELQGTVPGYGPPGCSRVATGSWDPPGQHGQPPAALLEQDSMPHVPELHLVEAAMPGAVGTQTQGVRDIRALCPAPQARPQRLLQGGPVTLGLLETGEMPAPQSQGSPVMERAGSELQEEGVADPSEAPPAGPGAQGMEHLASLARDTEPHAQSTRGPAEACQAPETLPRPPVPPQAGNLEVGEPHGAARSRPEPQTPAPRWLEPRPAQGRLPGGEWVLVPERQHVAPALEALRAQGMLQRQLPALQPRGASEPCRSQGQHQEPRLVQVPEPGQTQGSSTQQVPLQEAPGTRQRGLELQPPLPQWLEPQTPALETLRAQGMLQRQLPALQLRGPVPGRPEVPRAPELEGGTAPQSQPPSPPGATARPGSHNQHLRPECNRPWPCPLRREKAFVLPSRAEQQAAVRELAVLQQRARSRCQQDRERQLLRVQERLCIARDRKAEDNCVGTWAGDLAQLRQQARPCPDASSAPQVR
ncbi:kielin/chordin-like protein [Alligator sinensis]|uniref:Kielin/chordin-like protein n=1 Tax=Alligator sinensis TaxID=38654 RepID=A0A3Q0HGZ0_ALLSI|nr:kielin/chordin-like protein [Alligator sinensis]